MANNSNNFSVRSVLEKDKLTGTNFLDWQRNLRIVLKQERKLYVIDIPRPTPLAEGSTRAQHTAYQKHIDDDTDVQCLMLATMSAELQKQHENMDSYDMIEHLKRMFEGQARQERFDTFKSLNACKQGERDPVGPHVLKMIGYIDYLEKLGAPIGPEHQIDLILQSLNNNYSQFVMNYNMNEIIKNSTELLAMLKTAETNIQKASPTPILMVNKGKAKGKGKWKGKKKMGSNSNANPKPGPTKALKPKGGVQKEGDCHYCKKPGHWKRNCHAYLEDLKKKKAAAASDSGIYVIEVNLSTSTSWVLDTGCGSHICMNVQELQGSRTLAKGEVDLRVGNGAKVAAIAVGTYHLSLPTGLILELENCFYVPAICRNIISVSCLDKKGFAFSIQNNSCSFSLNNVTYGVARLFNGLYVLDLDTPIYNVNNKRLKTDDSNKTYLWHCRLGHINEKRISKLHKDGYLDKFDFESYEACEPCLIGKMTKAPFTGQGERATERLELIHSDVCGPMRTMARGGFYYFITFTDDFSRYGYVYLMKNKSDSFEKFKEYKAEVEKQTTKSIKTLRSDRGGEYLSQEFKNFLKECGIVSQLTPPGTPQWNGVSERRNRTLLDMVRSMMSHADLPISFWGYALETAAYTLNRVPTKTVQNTPYEIWTEKRHSMSFMKIWGCEAFVKRQNSDKLGPKSDKCNFVGYPIETRGYSFYNPSENKVFVARTAVFLEREMLSKKNSGRIIDLDEVREPHDNIEPEQEPEQDVHQNIESNPVPETQVVRRSSRVRHEPERYYGFLLTQTGDVMLMDNDEPLTYKDAKNTPDSKRWLDAMKSEMDSMYENQVWTLVDLPEGVKPIECKWVFKKKTDMDGNVQTYKARLVAKGFRQIHGIDYDETFSPVAMVKSIRILLAIAAYYDYEIWQMDVKTAFLNGSLEEDVYMTQPEGFVDPRFPKMVCKLRRSIYGLKQASRRWNIRFDETVKEFGFIQNEDEPCVYKKVSGSHVAFLVLYVDDILLMGNDIPSLQAVKTWLSKNFSMKDLGDATYILGIRIYRDRSRRLIGLSQSTYIDKVLHRFGMQEAKRGYVPMSHGILISKENSPKSLDDKDRMSKVPYASAIGSIMYAMICTRPDVSYALSMTSRYQSNPGEGHWTAVKNILKYLKRTKDQFLVYGGEEKLVVKGYTDASFQTDKDDSISQSGFVFCLNGGAVSWKSSKQETVADSTMEAEYIAACEAAKEAVWIRKFLTGLDVVPSVSDPIDLYCDNNGAISQAKEPRSHSRTKHILRRYHLLREINTRGDIHICKVHTDDNIADPLTKALSQQKHEGHTSSMGIRYIRDWL